MRNPKSQKHAIALRHNMTDAEQHLWRRLKLRQLNGSKFRRQHPVGPYITDFACLEARLIVELDGGQHNQPETTDQGRDAYLRSQGFRVLRFWNDQVFHETDAVLQVILDSLLAPIPAFPRERGKETKTSQSPPPPAGEG